MNAPAIITPDRSKFIGGSDVAAILGLSRYKNALDVWMEKTGIGQPEEITPEREAIFARGKRFEPLLIEMAQEEIGIKVVRTNQRYVDKDAPYRACEIDFETDQDENGEIKTAHPLLAAQWGEAGTDAAPVYYVAQTMWGLGITGRKRAILYAAIGFDDRRHYIIERDEETIAGMRARVDEFWTQHVLTKTPPQIDYSHPGAIDSLERLFSSVVEKNVIADPIIESYRAVYEDAAKHIARYESLRDGAKAHLLEMLGEGNRLIFADGKEFRRKRTKRKGYTVDAVEYIDFRLVNSKE